MISWGHLLAGDSSPVQGQLHDIEQIQVGFRKKSGTTD